MEVFSAPRHVDYWTSSAPPTSRQAPRPRPVAMAGRSNGGGPRKARAMRARASDPRLHLGDGDGHKLIHPGVNFRFAEPDPSGYQIRHPLSENAGIAAAVDIGRDDGLGIGIGGFAFDPELFGGPKPERSGAAGLGPELPVTAAVRFFSLS